MKVTVPKLKCAIFPEKYVLDKRTGKARKRRNMEMTSKEIKKLKRGARVLYTLISFDKRGIQVSRHTVRARDENHARKIAYVYRVGHNCREKKKIARTEVWPRYEIKCDYDRWHTTAKQGLF